MISSLFPLRLHHKKQVQGLNNFENNNPAATYGATAATGTSTAMQTPTGSGRQTIISEHHNEQQPLIFSRPPMQRQNQNRLPGDQVLPVSNNFFVL
jgi:hypothetical protein